MVNQKQLHEQVMNLEDLSERVAEQRDNIDYLEEIKNTEGLTELKTQLELAQEQIDLNIGAIARRVNKLTPGDAEKFASLVPDSLKERVSEIVSESESSHKEQTENSESTS